jgi:hypothetical protein
MATPYDLLLLGGGALLLEEDVSTELVMAGATRGRLAGGPRIRREEDTLPPGSRPGGGGADGVVGLRTTAYSLPGDDFVADIPDALSRQWLDQLNEPGTGTLQLTNTDPILGDLGINQIVRFILYGEVVFAFIIEQIERVLVDPGEESSQLTTLSGRGISAFLEWALVYPARGVERLPIEQDRVFNWTAPSGTYDDSTWTFASAFVTVDNAKFTGGAEWVLQPTGEGFPDLTGAFFIWAPGATLDIAPPGDIYLRKDFVAGDDGRYVMYLLIDNYGEVYLDGALLTAVNPADGFQNVTFVPIDLSAGTHTIAIHAVNAPDDGPPGGNPGGVAMALFNADQANNPIAVVAVTDSSWKGVYYPPFPPGMTPGAAIIVCVNEAQARGALGWLTVDFSGVVDSNGQPWPEVGDIATKTGTDLLTFLRELSGTYIDFWVSPGDLVLHAYVKDTRGAPAAVSLHPPTDIEDPGTGNLRSHSRRVQ